MQEIQHDTLEEAFPVVDTGVRPCGARVLIQLRQVKKKAKSGIIFVEETKETEKHQNMIGKVIAIGPIAFKNRDTMQDWPEGVWCKVGDYVRVPRWSGDRFEVELPRKEGDDERLPPEMASFTVMNDHELWCVVDPDKVLGMKAFV